MAKLLLDPFDDAMEKQSKYGVYLYKHQRKNTRYTCKKQIKNVQELLCQGRILHFNNFSCLRKKKKKIFLICFSMSMTTAPPPTADIDFDALTWNMNCKEKVKIVMVSCSGGLEAKWGKEHYDPETNTGSVLEPVMYQSLHCPPAHTSLNYGLSVWEGLKAYRTAEEHSVHVFRADANWERLNFGASRLGLPPVPFDMFMATVRAVIHANAELIPPAGDGMKLYLRPMLMASGQQLGLEPSTEYTFCVYATPSSNFFKGTSKPTGLKLRLESKFARAVKGGVGNIKMPGNYAQCFLPTRKSKSQGYSDNLYIDHTTISDDGGLASAVLQELGAANVFIIQTSKGRILTPSLDRGTILPGITRNSILTLSRYYNSEIAAACGKEQLEIVEMDVTVAELEHAEEAFACGTAAEIVPIQSFENKEYNVKVQLAESMGPVTTAIHKLLKDTMMGSRPDPFGWNRNPFGTVESFLAPPKPLNSEYQQSPLVPEAFFQLLE